MSLSTHVLDTATGDPRAGVPIELSMLLRPDPGEEDQLMPWIRMTEVITDRDGRATLIADPDPDDPRDADVVGVEGGIYRLRFEVSPAAHGVEPPAVVPHPSMVFYPWIDVVFATLTVPRLHIPLLLSPFGYTTYRGS